jgi:hypothetical protein
MRLWRRRDRPVETVGLKEARRERKTAEERLAKAREDVIIPLHELREKNHVSEAISMLISRANQGRT